MKLVPRTDIDEIGSQDTYDETADNVILGAGLFGNLYQYDLKRERVVEMDPDIDVSTPIVDICEKDEKVYLGTEEGIFTTGGKNVSLGGKEILSVEVLDGRFVYSSKRRSEEVRDNYGNILWHSDGAEVKEISVFEGEIYVTSHKGSSPTKKLLYSVNEGFLDKIEDKVSSNSFMTEFDGELYGSFGTTTWKVSGEDSKLETQRNGSREKLGLFKYGSALMEARRKEGIHEAFSSNDEPLVPYEHLTDMRVFRTVSKESFDNIDAEVVEVDDIEVRGDWN